MEKGKEFFELLQTQNQTTTLLKTNEVSEQYGLVLTEQDAKLLMVERKDSLMRQRRVEFAEGILPKLIYAFADSQYLNQENYVQTLIELQDLFYMYKNEMLDEITDDELINFMREQFETTCYGDITYLGGTCLEIFAEAIRAGYNGFQETEGSGVYASLDEVPRWDHGLYLEALQELLI